jgi:hypothetical protein
MVIVTIFEYRTQKLTVLVFAKSLKMEDEGMVLLQLRKKCPFLISTPDVHVDKI